MCLRYSSSIWTSPVPAYSSEAYPRRAPCPANTLAGKASNQQSLQSGSAWHCSPRSSKFIAVVLLGTNTSGRVSRMRRAPTSWTLVLNREEVHKLKDFCRACRRAVEHCMSKYSCYGMFCEYSPNTLFKYYGPEGRYIPVLPRLVARYSSELADAHGSVLCTLPEECCHH